MDGDNDTPSSTPAINPAAVNYHDDEQRCELCDHFGDGGQCAVLQMQVQAAGGCNAFTTGDDSQGGDTTPDMNDDDSTGMSGGYGT